MRQKIFDYFFGSAPFAGFIFFGCLFWLLGILNEINTNKQILFNSTKFKNIKISIDSLSTSSMDGPGSAVIVRGYTFEPNYKNIIIDFDIPEDEEFDKITNKQLSNEKFDVWYYKNSKFAYPASEGEKIFPVNKYWSKHIFRLAIILFATLNFIYWKQKNKKNNENNK